MGGTRFATLEIWMKVKVWGEERHVVKKEFSPGVVQFPPPPHYVTLPEPRAFSGTGPSQEGGLISHMLDAQHRENGRMQL